MNYTETMPLHTPFVILGLGHPRCLIEVDGEPISRLVTPDELHERVAANQKYEDDKLREKIFYNNNGQEIFWYMTTYKKDRERNINMEKFNKALAKTLEL